MKLLQRTSPASRSQLLNQRIAGAAVKLVFTLYNTLVICEMAVLLTPLLWWVMRLIRIEIKKLLGACLR
jgi:hypothetical protein